MTDNLPDAWAQARTGTQHHSVFGMSTPPRQAGAAPSGADPSNTNVNRGQLAMLPWAKIPTFIPGETSVETYARSVQLLFVMWPAQARECFVAAVLLKVEG